MTERSKKMLTEYILNEPMKPITLLLPNNSKTKDEVIKIKNITRVLR